jgi:hypothetical protein
VTSLIDFLYVVNLLAAAILAGGQVFMLVTVVPARRAWSPGVAVRVHQDALTHRPDRVLRPCALVAIVTAALLLALGRAGPFATALIGAGLLGQLVNAVISARFEAPLNREINGWSADAVPERYPALRDDWDRKHRLRTLASVLALACLVVALLLRQRP